MDIIADFSRIASADRKPFPGRELYFIAEGRLSACEVGDDGINFNVRLAENS